MNSAHKNRSIKLPGSVFGTVLFLTFFASVTYASQLVTQLGSTFAPPIGADGNCGTPIISADGRYVVFASSANNLAVIGNNPIQTRVLGNLNVYVRDRTNQTTALVSVNMAGTGGGNGDSLPRAISTNGQYVLFESTASNLVANDINIVGDIFVRDLVNHITTLVSVNTNGVSGNLPSSSSVMTPDGRYVAFSSWANNLVPGDTNSIPDIFVRDLIGGTTSLISVGAVATNAGPPNGLISFSDSPAITPDGRYVVFYSTATNLLPNVRTGSEIYVRDRVGGTTIWASSGSRGSWFPPAIFPSVVSCNFEISDNDNFVAYEAIGTPGVILRYGLQSGLTDLIATNAYAPPISLQNPLSLHSLDLTPDGRFITYVTITGSPLDVTDNIVYLWDALSGSNMLVSINTNGVASPGVICDTPAVSANGQFVAFLSSATDLIANSLSGEYHLFLRDMVNSNTTLLDADSNGYGFGVNSSTIPVMTPDGTVTVFESRNLFPDRRHEFTDVLARNRLAASPELISAGNALLPNQSPDGISGLSAYSVNTNGQFIAFYSDADDIVPGDTNGFRDVFVRNQALGTNILVSVQITGVSPGDGISTDPAISGDGHLVAFTSAADNLVQNDTNRDLDVFVRDLQNQTTVLASLGANGVDPGNGDSYSPIISADGRYVLFRSKASNLATGSAGGGNENLIFRDLQAGTNDTVATGTAPYGVVATPDLQYVAFIGTPPGKSGALYVWNSRLNAFVYTNTSGFGSGVLPLVAISANGGELAYLANSPFGLYVVDLALGNVSNVVASGTFSSHATFQLSADGHYLAYSYQTSSTAIQNVYLYDTLAGTSIQVNQSFFTLHGTNGNSDSPVISPDGRYVAYRSLASVIVPDDISPAENMFIYDRANNATILASVDLSGSSTANDNSLKPVFSGDSQTLAFETFASDLVTNDFNGGSSIVALNLAALPVTVAGGGGGSSNAPVLSAQLMLPGTISSNLAVVWPLASGAAYQVQYKTNLNDAVWQVLPGAPAFIGDTGFMDDTTPAGLQKFYRIVLTTP